MGNTEQSDFLAAFGIDEEIPPVDPPEDVDPPEEIDPPETTDPEEDTDPPEDVDPPEEIDPPADPPADDKSSRAFAQMRTENSTYKNTLNGVAALLGIGDVADPAELAEAIKVKVLEAQAKKDNVPIELLQKVDRLEQLEKQFTDEQLRTRTAIGLQNIQTKFKLDDAGIMAFAQSLLDDGKNPYEQPVDFMEEYLKRNWEALETAAEERGKAAEIKRAAKAKEQSTNPGKNNGGTPGSQDKINTIDELSAYLNQA